MARERRTGRTVALVGGAALAVWLLSRGKGWGFRGPGDASGAAHPARSVARPVVWVRADRIEIDGVAADLPTVIERARVAGAVSVRATGDAITGVIRNVIEALHRAGVTIHTTPDLSSIAPSTVLR